MRMNRSTLAVLFSVAACLVASNARAAEPAAAAHPAAMPRDHAALVVVAAGREPAVFEHRKPRGVPPRG